MNKTISLPHIKKNEQSKPPSRKKSSDSFRMETITERSQHNNEEAKIMVNKKINRSLSQHQSLNLGKKTNTKPRAEDKSQNNQTERSRSKSILDNSILSKITQRSLIPSKSGDAKVQGENSEHQRYILKIRKELNEVSGRSIVMTKQVKAMEGRLTQIKEHIKKLELELHPHNQKTTKAVQKVKDKIEVQSYDRDILKHMKDRLKKVTLLLDKRLVESKATLERAKKKQRSLYENGVSKQQQINKALYRYQQFNNKESTKTKQTNLEIQEFQNRIKEEKELKEMNDKYKEFHLLDQNEYHYDVYKKQEAQLFRKLHSNLFLHKLLQRHWEQASSQYRDLEKSEKLIKMHCLEKEEEINPQKVYFDSFETKKELESKILQKEAQLAEAKMKNIKLSKKWEEIEYKEVDEQEKVYSKMGNEAKFGVVEAKEIEDQKYREYASNLKKRFEQSQNRQKLLSALSDWAKKMKVILPSSKRDSNYNLDDRLLDIIRCTTMELQEFLIKKTEEMLEQQEKKSTEKKQSPRRK